MRKRTFGRWSLASRALATSPARKSVTLGKHEKARIRERMPATGRRLQTWAVRKKEQRKRGTGRHPGEVIIIERVFSLINRRPDRAPGFFRRLFGCLPRQPTFPRRILFDRGQHRRRPKYVRRIVGSTGGHTFGARSSFLRSPLAWRLPLCGASTVPKISSVPRAFLVFPASLTPSPSPRPMKSQTEYLTFNLPARMAFENITPQVEAIVKKSGVREGLVLVNAMHITASVFINDNESGLHEDYKKWLEGLAPFDPSPTRYAHNRTGEDNADAHMKRQVMGREVVVAITNGKLDFGPWEQIFYGEFDGRRPKRVLVKVIGE